jgi:hypothetical protein
MGGSHGHDSKDVGAARLLGQVVGNQDTAVCGLMASRRKSMKLHLESTTSAPSEDVIEVRARRAVCACVRACVSTCVCACVCVSMRVCS